MEPIRILQRGLGTMGSSMSKLILTKPGLQIAATVDGIPEYAG